MGVCSIHYQIHVCIYILHLLMYILLHTIYMCVCVGKLYKVCIYSIYALQVYYTYVSKYVNTIYTIYILCVYIYIESSFDAITPENPPLGPRDQFQLVQLAFPASVEGNPQAPQEGPMGRPHHSLLRLWRY